MFRTYPRDFWRISASMFFFILSFNLILPEMNAYITLLGGQTWKGSIIFLFSIAAGLSRPFAGKLADLIGRKKSIYIGILISLIVCLSYPFFQFLVIFLLLRFLHGLSAGFAPTGATALVTDILPSERKGAAMGLWGTFISLGIGVGQALGSYIFARSNFQILFLSAGIFALCAFLFVIPIKETLPSPIRFKFAHLRVKWTDVFEPSVRNAAAIMLLTAISSGVIFVLSPDLSTYFNIENKGYFFGVYVLSTIIMRLAFSSISDKIGRKETLVIGCTILVLSMSLLALSKGMMSYTLAAIFFGLATGISSPTLFAWTADLSPSKRRGSGAGTLFLALELGILVGSGLTVFIYKNTLQSAQNCIWIATFFALIAVLLLAIEINKTKQGVLNRGSVSLHNDPSK